MCVNLIVFCTLVFSMSQVKIREKKGYKKEVIFDKAKSLTITFNGIFLSFNWYNNQSNLKCKKQKPQTVWFKTIKWKMKKKEE